MNLFTKEESLIKDLECSHSQRFCIATFYLNIPLDITEMLPLRKTQQPQEKGKIFLNLRFDLQWEELRIPGNVKCRE